MFRAPTESTCSDFGPFLQQPKEETKTIHDDENEEVEEKKKVDGRFLFARIIPIFLKGIKPDADLCWVVVSNFLFSSLPGEMIHFD